MFAKCTLAAVFLFLTSFTLPSAPERSFEGAWKIAEVRTIRADGQSTVVKPRESLVLFANGYYSFCWTSHQSSAQAWQIADSERVARFNQMLVNTGTYTVSESLLVTHAQFAQVPKFVGGTAAFRWALSNDTLVLTGVNVLSADNILHSIYAAGGHVVNKLVRIK